MKCVRDKLRPVMKDWQINAQRVCLGYDVGTVVSRVAIDHPEDDALRSELVAQGFDRGDHLCHAQATIAGEDQYDAFDSGIVLEIVERSRGSLMIDQPKIIRVFEDSAKLIRGHLHGPIKT